MDRRVERGRSSECVWLPCFNIPGEGGGGWVIRIHRYTQVMTCFPMGGPELDTYLSLPHYLTLSCGETLLDAVPRLVNPKFW